jgi:ABC-type branched-subunit amino acid transport system substrate-binding protein
MAVALAVGSALVASAACGTRVPDETEAAGGGLGGGGGPVASSGGAPGAEVEGDDPATFGSLPIPCGPGPEDRSGYGDTDVGVSADEIRIGTIADPGGPKPGLNQGVFDAMDAFVGWCNDLGGINGRRIVLTKRDGKILEYKQRVIEACDEGDFALVGGLGIFDNTGVQEQIDCGLPNVPASAVNPEQAMADLTWLGLPNPSNILETGVAQWLVDNYPDAVTRAGMQFTNTQTTQMQAERVMEGYEKVGFTWVNEQATNINETNWAPIVVTLRNEDVRFLNIVNSFEEVVPLLKEMDTQDYRPLIQLEANYYNDKFPEQAGATADGILIRLTVTPFEEADQNPAMTDFLAILDEYKPDAVRELLGVQAFSGGLLWATAASSLGADLTRAGLEEALDDIHEWNGGGLHAVADPGNNTPGGCFMLLRIEDGAFVRHYPLPDDPIYQDGFACPEPSQVELTNRDYAALGAKREG